MDADQVSQEIEPHSHVAPRTRRAVWSIDQKDIEKMPRRQDIFLRCTEVIAALLLIVSFGIGGLCFFALALPREEPPSPFEPLSRMTLFLTGIANIIAAFFWGALWEVIKIIRRIDMATDIIVRNVASSGGEE